MLGFIEVVGDYIGNYFFLIKCSKFYLCSYYWSYVCYWTCMDSRC